MARMIGVATEASIGRRLLQEAPDFGEDETFTRMRSVLESGRPEVVEVAVASGEGPIGRVRGVFLHRAIPFGAHGVLNLVTDVTERRRALENPLRADTDVAPEQALWGPRRDVVQGGEVLNASGGPDVTHGLMTLATSVALGSWTSARGARNRSIRAIMFV